MCNFQFAIHFTTADTDEKSDPVAKLNNFFCEIFLCVLCGLNGLSASLTIVSSFSASFSTFSAREAPPIPSSRRCRSCPPCDASSGHLDPRHRRLPILKVAASSAAFQCIV